ncbi:MAG: hypothetical protein WKF41_03880 [Gaiellaceae bacterium]
MRPLAGWGSATSSERALDRLRCDLQPTLLALDRAAADPEALDELADDLPALQYALHAAAEQALDSPSDRAASGALDAARAAAGEETADVAETLADAGADAVAPLLWEWRAALFGVRLALLRLEEGGTEKAPPPLPAATVPPLLLLGFGVALVLGGALADTWPLWILGLALVTASTGLSQRP